MKTDGRHQRIKSHSGASPAPLLSLMPLAAFLIVGFTGTQPLSPMTRHVLTEGSELSRQIVYGAIYLWALSLVLRHWSEQKELLRASLLPLLFILCCFISFLWSQFPFKVIKDTMHLLGMLFVVVVAVPTIRQDSSRFPALIFYVTTAIVTISLMTIYLYPEGSIVSLPNQRWRGVTSHPNSLGLAATLCLASSLIQLPGRRTLQRAILLIPTISSSIICLLASDSKTSLIIAWVIPFVFSLYLLSRLDASSYPKLLLIIHVLFVTSVIFHFAYLFFPDSLEYKKILSSLGRTENLTGRKYLWDMGWRAFGNNPIFGCGFDGLLSAQKQFFQHDLLFAQLHNGYLELLVKTGVIGTVLTSTLLISYIRALFREKSVSPEVFCFILFLFVATLLHNFSESSIFSPNNALFSLFLCSYLVIYPIKGNGLREPSASQNASSLDTPNSGPLQKPLLYL